MAENVETAVYRLRVEGQAEIDRLTKSVDGLAVAEEKATAANRTFSQTLQNNVARIDPLVRAQEQYRKALETNLRYRETGVGTEAQLNAQLEASTKRYQQQVSVINQVEKATVSHTNAQKLQGYQMLNLSRQIQDVGVSLFGGQSPFTVAAQQLPQIFDISQQSGVSLTNMFKQAGSAARSFVTPARLAMASVVGIGAAAVVAAAQWMSAQKDIENSLLGIGARSGATASSINKFAQGGGLGGLSVSERRGIGTEFARTGELDASKITGIAEAVQGYATITGKTATEATKDLAQALSGDLSKGMQDLSKVFGDFDPTLRDVIDGFMKMGDRTSAVKAIIATLAPEIERANDSLSAWAKTWNFVGNVASNTFDILGEGVAKIATFHLGDVFGGRERRESAAQAAGFAMQDTTVRAKGQAAIEDVEPQIAQIRKLEQALADLQRAKLGVGATGPIPPIVDPGAEQIIKNTIAATKDIKSNSEAWAQTVAKVREEYKGVSESAAMAVHAQEAQLPVIDAIGGAAKMAAQYTKDYNDTWEKTHNAVEATTVAMENQKITQAQINASAKETLWNLQNQAAAAGAVTGAQQMAAQAAATYNQMVHDGVDATIASAVAAQQLANAQAQATANVLRQVEALKDSTAMIKAQQYGTENITAAAIAYKNAIQSGASSTAAAALSAETLANYAAKAAAAADQMARSMDATSRSYAMSAGSLNAGMDVAMQTAPVMGGNQSNAFSANPMNFAPTVMTGSYTTDIDPRRMNRNEAMMVGRAALANYAKQASAAGGSVLNNPDLAYGTIGGVSSYYTKDALAAQDKLTNSIDDLKKSTDSLNSTNQDLLSPYYTQDPRTTHIGFRSQGMALGGYVEVPGGYSSNDNMLASIPVASGERIYVDPMTNRRGTASPGSPMVINISSPITINGPANADQFGRTVYQNNQMLAKQVRAAIQ